jgi:hypothetical protein
MKSRECGSEYATDISKLTLPQGRRDFKNKRKDTVDLFYCKGLNPNYLS